MNRPVFERFLFALRELSATGDLDPLYPFLRNLISRLMTVEPDFDSLWLVQLYAAYYNVASAYTVYLIFPQRHYLVDLHDYRLKQSIARERRNLRSPVRMREHLYQIQHKPLEAWFARRWQGVYDEALTIRHNGPWAAFKWTDLARYVLDWTLDPTPPSVASGSGPAAGLALLECKLPELALELPVAVPWDQIETALCKWHGMETGHYLLGQDLIELEGQVAPWTVLRDVFHTTDFRVPVEA